jgi:hypothetical protein
LFIIGHQILVAKGTHDISPIEFPSAPHFDVSVDKHAFVIQKCAGVCS